MSTSEWAYKMVEMWGKDRAISELIKKIDDDRLSDNELFASRFFELVSEMNDDQEPTGRKYLTKRTEKFISSTVDLADCAGDYERQFLYMEDDGSLHPIHIGQMTRWAIEEHEVVFGASDMIVNGKVVGTVQFTDH